ncbi:MAG: 2-dehydropantoate 2-reductase [Chloroflexaceae bacterium]|nr:2-dehydropantoate 2-reductase [Chloroflexaceae bacterium]
MHIGVFGVGGVGGYFGGRLAQAGEQVVFIARGQHLAAMQRDGLRIESIKGDALVQPVQATDDPHAAGVVDVLLVGVKAWQVSEAAAQMRPMVGPETMVVPLQNGVEAAEQLAAVFGRERVIGGLCRIFSHVAAPGVIRHLSAEPTIIINELDNTTTARVEQIHTALVRAGIDAQIAPDIHVALWSKFAFVCPTGTLGAVTRLSMGIVRTQPETRQMLEQAVQEVLTVARARGVPMPAESFECTMALIEKTAADAITSMQRDIMDGRPSELEAQPGAVARLGSAAGVEVPIHTFVYHSLLPLERQARGLI